MKTMVTLTHEEAQSYLAYALICETMEGAFWNSGRRRRLYSKTFTEAEQRQIPRIKATAHKWCLVTGVPEKVPALRPGICTAQTATLTGAFSK